MLPNDKLASGAGRILSLWDVNTLREITRFYFDADIVGIAPLNGERLVVADYVGRIHCLAILMAD